jgi:hypothetical protein
VQAHTRGEHVAIEALTRSHDALAALLRRGAG